MACQEALTLINGATITETGAGSSVSPSPRKNKWAAYLSVGEVTGTNPTLDVTIQHSVDGTNWVTLIAMTQVTTSSAVEHKFASSATDYLKPILPYVRASYVVGGTDEPTFAAVTVKLLVDE